ncbi:MAG: hypothetical protein JOZ88_13995 [Hyphomicrobiales bacterium]|nr:hypothetical protein [Hyphomicrobiales bacterium]
MPVVDIDPSQGRSPLQAVVIHIRVGRSAKELRSSAAVRIAQIAPLHKRVPPKLYGGTERESRFHRGLGRAQKIRQRLGGCLSTLDDLPEKPKACTGERTSDCALNMIVRMPNQRLPCSTF